MILLCTHIHKQAGFFHINETLVINCAMNKYATGAIIEYEQDKPLRVDMLLKTTESKRDRQ
jgi:Icc-related predicted phosphoesterase